MVNINFTAGFATAIKNVHDIVNEAKELQVVPSVYKFVRMIEGYLNEIEFRTMFMEDGEEEYVGENVIVYVNAMKTVLSRTYVMRHSNEYKVINSVCDILQEFYEEYCVVPKQQYVVFLM